jgi:hypothetical protein
MKVKNCVEEMKIGSITMIEELNTGVLSQQRSPRASHCFCVHILNYLINLINLIAAGTLITTITTTTTKPRAELLLLIPQKQKQWTRLAHPFPLAALLPPLTLPPPPTPPAPAPAP